MKQSTKGAWTALVVIVALTTIKFVFYFISGSIAVLSEAWHSFADIATTLLVIVSIVRQQHKSAKQLVPDSSPITGEETAEKYTNSSSVLRWRNWFHSINTELKVSIVICIVLISAATGILWQAVFSEPAEINNPLVTGLVFIVLSFGSFFLYRFEESIGNTEKSAALIADSHHNRADVVISLLTGISLIFYHFGFNLDRLVGVLIAAYILSFSIELLVNTIRSILNKNQEVAFEYKISSIIWQLFKPQTYRVLFQWIGVRVNIGEKGKRILTALPGLSRQVLKWSFRMGTVILAGIYLSTAVYTVNPDEQALILRFGKIANTAEAIQPGIHLKFPDPVDTVVRIQTERVRSLHVGNRSDLKKAMIWTKDHGDNLTFISADNNLFLPYVVVHYRIKNIHDYYLTYRRGIPEKILESTSYHLLTRVFSGTSYFDLILNKRKTWTLALKQELQDVVDQMKTGLEIVEFCVKDLHPPIDLAGAYEDVVASAQMKETYLNNAQRRLNLLLSQARMDAFQTVAEAQSYVIEKKALAKGEAENYLLRYSGYKAGGKTMNNLLHLKAAQQTLKDKRLILVDPRSGIENKLIYIENHVTGGKKR